MKPQELRIGNYVRVLFDEENYYEVSGIIQEMNDEPYGVELKGSTGMFTMCFIEDLEPIPLTEEWLLKFGYESIQELACHFDDINISGIELYSETGIIFLQTMKVHTLQNYWFFNTRSELEIKTTC